MQEQKQRLPIGALLEKFGYINSAQIDVALSVQRANKLMLGEILQELDFVTSSEIAEVIATQYEMEYRDVDNEIITQEALSLIPYNIAQSKLILPIKIENKVLTVATVDVSDLDTIDYLNSTIDYEIKYVIGDKNKIQKNIDLKYFQLENPIEVEIDNIVEAINNDESVDVINLVDLIIDNAIKDRATDIHITPDANVIYIFFRLDGVLHHFHALHKDVLQPIISRIKILSRMDISEHRLPQDGAFSHEFIGNKYDLRVSTLPTNHGENIVMRILASSTSDFNLSGLGFSRGEVLQMKNLFSKPYGIVLVTGPTGSGKTTTLYSLLRHINFIEKNVLTIEDPIEYRFSFARQTEVNERAGYTFAKAIRHFLRQDPDVMLVGEMRDEETAELATRAAITGHLVLSTLHTNDAVGAVPRLLDLGIKDYLLSSSIVAVLAQRLVRKLCPVCKEEFSASKQEFIALGAHEDDLQLHGDTITVYIEKGCTHCNHTGYSGREAVIEVLIFDQHMKEMITKGAAPLEIEKYARETQGMKIMKENAVRKVLEGITSANEINRVFV